MYRGGLYRELMLATGSRKILVAVRKIKKACYLNKTHQKQGTCERSMHTMLAGQAIDVHQNQLRRRLSKKERSEANGCFVMYIDVSVKKLFSIVCVCFCHPAFLTALQVT